MSGEYQLIFLFVSLHIGISEDRLDDIQIKEFLTKRRRLDASRKVLYGPLRAGGRINYKDVCKVVILVV